MAISARTRSVIREMASWDSEAPPPILHHHWREGSVPVTRHLDVDLLDVLGQQRLDPGAVAGAPGPSTGQRA